MSSKLGLYIRTVLGLVPSQIRSRFRRMAGFDTPLPGAAVNEVLEGLPARLSEVSGLDFDPGSQRVVVSLNSPLSKDSVNVLVGCEKD